MFEKVVAYILNKYICKYVSDLDPEHLNVGIFSGTVQLTDLQLKAEAFGQLDLPIEVKAGQIGKVSIDIPWTTLTSDPVLIHIEDVLIIVAPVNCATEEYDSDHEKLLLRAQKLEKLNQIYSKKADAITQDGASFFSKLSSEPKNFFNNLLAAVVNNVQISLQSVHIRYEDTVTLGLTNGRAITGGIAFQSLTAITTNHKWKPAQIDENSSNIFKLVKLETLYVYWNADTSTEKLVQNYLPKEKSLNGPLSSANPAASCKYEWTEMMKKSIFDCSICGEEFDFVLKPIIAKLKLIINKSNEQRVPKLLIDCVLQDASITFSKCQYRGLVQVIDSFELISLNRRYWKHKPRGSQLLIMTERPIKGQEKAKLWWHFAIKSVLEEFIRPYSWQRISQHRCAFKKCVAMYCDLLLNPLNAELKVDLQKAENDLDVTNLLLAQQQAKLELLKRHPERRENLDEVIEVASGQTSFSKLLSSEERQKIYDLLDDSKDQHSSATVMVVVDDMSSDCDPESDSQYIGHKLNFTLANATINLVVDGKDIFVFTFNTIMLSLETKPNISGYKLSIRCESFFIEAIAQAVGPDLDDILIPIVTGDLSTTTTPKGSPKSPYIFALDIESNSPDSNSKYALNLCIESIEIIYSIVNINELISFFQRPHSGTKSSRAIHTLLREIATSAKQSAKDLVKHSQQGLISVSIDCKSPYLVIPENGKLAAGQRGPAGRLLIVDLGRLLVKTDAHSNEQVQEDELDRHGMDLTQFNCNLTDVQVLFTDDGTEEDEWRCALKVAESDLHLLKRVNIHFIWSMFNPQQIQDSTFSNSSKHKISISMPSMKLNLSDRRLRLLFEFLRQTPLPNLKRESSAESYYHNLEAPIQNDAEIAQGADYSVEITECQLEPTVEELRSLINKFKSSIEGVSISSESGTTMSKESRENVPQEAANFPNGDISSSTRSSITSLFTISIDNIGIDCCRSNQSAIHCERPYLMANASQFSLEIALHDETSQEESSKKRFFARNLIAVAATLGKLHIVDKQFTCSNGKYLELIYSDQLKLKFNYRQTSEQNLVEINLGPVNLTIHKESVVSLIKFFSHLMSSIRKPSRSPTPSAARLTPQPEFENSTESAWKTALFPKAIGEMSNQEENLSKDTKDLKILLQLEKLRAILCDARTDLALISLDGVKCDYHTQPDTMNEGQKPFYSRPFKIDLGLSNLEIHNLSDIEENSLYSKILIPIPLSPPAASIDQPSKLKSQNLFEISLEHSAGSYSVAMKLAKMQLILLYPFIREMQMFLVPLLKSNYADPLKRTVRRTMSETFKVLSFSAGPENHPDHLSTTINGREQAADKISSKLALNLDVQAPILLLPYKLTCPDLIVLNSGQFTVDNFTQKPVSEAKAGQQQILINEWDLKLNCASLHRGIIRPDGGHEILFDLIRSSSIAFTLRQAILSSGKRLTCFEGPYDALEFELESSIDNLEVWLQQSDIRLMARVYEENLKKIIVTPKIKKYSMASTISTPDLSSTTTSDHEEPDSKPKSRSQSKISREQTITDENFSSDETHNRDHAIKAHACIVKGRQEEVNKKKKKQAKIRFANLMVTLTADEINQVSDGDHPLGPICRMNLDDVQIIFELFSNSSYSLTLDVAGAAIEDMLHEKMIINQRMSPLSPRNFLTVQYLKTPYGQGSFDFNIDQAHIGFNLAFITLMTKYFSGSLEKILPPRIDIKDISLAGSSQTLESGTGGNVDGSMTKTRKHRKTRRDMHSHANTSSSSDEELFPPSHPPHHHHSPNRQINQNQEK